VSRARADFAAARAAGFVEDTIASRVGDVDRKAIGAVRFLDRRRIIPDHQAAGALVELDVQHPQAADLIDAPYAIAREGDRAIPRTGHIDVPDRDADDVQRMDRLIVEALEESGVQDAARTGVGKAVAGGQRRLVVQYPGQRCVEGVTTVPAKVS